MCSQIKKYDQFGLNVLETVDIQGANVFVLLQETFVWELYQERSWDFFPVGDCFRKQYEEELSSS